MIRHLTYITTLLAVLSMALLLGCSSEDDFESKQASPDTQKKQYLAFGGGPTGGTFNFFANKMSSLISADQEWIDVSPKGSGGSAENLRSLNKNGLDMGIIYSGDAFLGRNGKLPDDATHYDRVRMLSFLYGAPAQLVVKGNSDIKTVHDLKGKTVAIGNPGSGAALSAERFFKHLGLWDEVEHRNLGYSQAASDFADNKIDAFWVLVGYPNSAVIEASTRTPIQLVNLHDDAAKSGFYDLYPFYSIVTIPAGTYDGQTNDVSTFQDSSLWCASADLDEKIVYQCLKNIYSEKGLKALLAAHKATNNMSIGNGINGASIPLHPGAVRFWNEQGMEIPSKLLP